MLEESLNNVGICKVIRVASSTSVSSLAGSIINALNDPHNASVVVKSMGAGATCQMYKGIASARRGIADKGMDLLIRPGFSTEVIDGKEKTVLVANLVIQK